MAHQVWGAISYSGVANFCSNNICNSFIRIKSVQQYSDRCEWLYFISFCGCRCNSKPNSGCNSQPCKSNSLFRNIHCRYSFGTSNAVSGTQFSWTRDHVADVSGIAPAGSGDVSGTLTNTTSDPITCDFHHYSNWSGTICMYWFYQFLQLSW